MFCTTAALKLRYQNHFECELKLCITLL